MRLKADVARFGLVVFLWQEWIRLAVAVLIELLSSFLLRFIGLASAACSDGEEYGAENQQPIAKGHRWTGVG